jgi:hypothetical protein
MTWLRRDNLPVTGAEQAENLLDPRAPPMNELMGEHRPG